MPVHDTISSEEMQCPWCESQIPIRMKICPNCETMLH